MWIESKDFSKVVCQLEKSSLVFLILCNNGDISTWKSVELYESNVKIYVGDGVIINLIVEDVDFLLDQVDPDGVERLESFMRGG